MNQKINILLRNMKIYPSEKQQLKELATAVSTEAVARAEVWTAQQLPVSATYHGRLSLFTPCADATGILKNPPHSAVLHTLKSCKMTGRPF